MIWLRRLAGIIDLKRPNGGCMVKFEPTPGALYRANRIEGVAMPSDAELAAYAKNLPPIYRDILAAFPEVEPGRKAGYGLAFQTMAAHFANTRRSWLLGDVRAACEQLASSGFIEIRNGIFAHPTELGERLIAAVSGKPRATSPAIPHLPAAPW